MTAESRQLPWEMLSKRIAEFSSGDVLVNRRCTCSPSMLDRGCHYDKGWKMSSDRAADKTLTWPFLCIPHPETDIYTITNTVIQSSYRCHAAKFTDFSSHWMTISLILENNNPIAQMSNTVHYRVGQKKLELFERW